MRRFESATLRRFDVVVAVSDRDALAFRSDHREVRTAVIPTGVDPDYFRFHEPVSNDHLVFCGSMDWLANQEAMNFFLDTIWDHIVAEVPDARLTVIGRAPPASLVEKAARRGANWAFTGYVDDVRPHMQGAAVSVIPMRVGGGTRLKVYEAMAAGTPIVSTTVGVEGLPIVDGKQYLRADEPLEFARAVVSLLKDSGMRRRMAADARALVESQFSYVNAARVFEEAGRLAILAANRP
jgi:glycosyltransferase involved in cell wall biosynthesis